MRGGQHTIARHGTERQSGRAVRDLHTRRSQRSTAEGNDRLRRRFLREQRHGGRVGTQRDAARRTGGRDVRGFSCVIVDH